MQQHTFPDEGRRRFLGASVGSLAAGLMVHGSAAAAGKPDALRLGVIGCGGRGTGAVNDSLTINDGVTLVAAADLDAAKCVALRKWAASAGHGEKVQLDDAHMYDGLDGYRRVLDDPAVDIVLLTTSPGFRPRHLLEAVEAGKHVFAEKPVCVDPAGYRICRAAHDKAVSNGTAIVTGTQYRRQGSFIEAIARIHEGAIGDVIAATTRYCTGGIWHRPRQPAMSDAQYQLFNWMHYIWLSGDQICEQAVHNIDIINWVMGANPETAFGVGGRFTRPADSEMWDAMSIDYLYPGNRTVSVICRQIPGAAADSSTIIHGSRGSCSLGSSNAGSAIFDRDGKQTWQVKGDIASAYRQEHKDLVDSIRSGAPIVELRQTADSSLTAVMGRLAAYTGQRVAWEFLVNESQLDLFPPHLSLDAALPPPQHAVPGKTPLV